MAWPLLAAILAAGAARRARRTIAGVVRSGSAVHGSFHRARALVPAMMFLNAATAVGVTRRLEGAVATLAFVVFATNVLQQVFVDLDTHLLPRARSRVAALSGAVLLFVASALGGEWGRWWWALCGALLAWFVLTLMRFASRGDLGGGDVSFGVPIGLHLGWLAIGDVALGLLAGFGLAGVQAVLLVVAGRGRRHFFAFGPALGAGALLTVVFSQTMRAFVLG